MLDVICSLAVVERARDVVAGARHLLEQVATALADRLDHRVAGAAERERDVLALFGQRTRHALRGVVHARGNHLADRRDVLRQAEVHAGDGVTHLLGLPDQRCRAGWRGLRCRPRMRSSLSL